MLPLKDNHKQNKIPYVNYLIILAMIGVFISELTHPDVDSFIFKWSLMPFLFKAYTNYSYVLAVFALFIHTSFFQLISSVLFLHIFGRKIEDYLGHLFYLLFYVGAGLTALFTQFAFIKHANLPLNGSSGAIAAVIGLYLTLDLQSKITVWFPVKSLKQVLELPAWFYAIVWILFYFLRHAGSIGAVQYKFEDTSWIGLIAGVCFGIAFGLMLRPFLKRK
jgi:membrane associated rhomboid family serine protease